MQLKKHLRRVLVFAGAFVLLFGLAIGSIIWWMGSRSIQDWIGSQIQGVANGYLNPQLSFSNLTYTYPLDVSLKNLRLTADDPANPGHSIDIIACDSAELALGEIPRIGKPIIIEKISLKSPLISAVSIQQGSKQFVGFSNLIKGGSTTVTEDKKPDSAPQKLSEVFRMRKVELIDGKIVYDPRIPGTVPMTIDQINTGLNIAPTENSWYTLNTAISRKPVFDLSVAGQFNLDNFAVRGLDLHLMTDLGQDKARFLPPELQVLLKKYQAKGKLDVAVTGDMPGMDWMHGTVHTTVKLDGANVTSGEFHLPVDGVLIDSNFADGKATLSSLKIQALGGSADLTGAVTLNTSLDADLHVKVVDMVLEKLRADPAMMSAAPAKLNFDFNLATSLMSFLGKAPASADKPLAAISLQNFRLTANDPASAGQTVDVVACKNLDVAMTTPYIAGKPIVIDKIVLDQPVLSAVAVAPGSIQFAGVPLLPSTPAPPGSPAAPVESSAPSTAPLVAPGDMLRVKEFQLNAAKIVYDPRIPNTQRMVIDPISTSLHLDPADPGTYAVNVNIGRAPVFNLAVNGQINIDHPGLQKLKLNLVADLQQHQLDFLPPQLQLMLQQSHARGKLNINADASVVLADPTHGTAAFDMNVANLDLQQGDLHVPIDSVAVTAKLAEGKFVETAKVATLANVFEIDGTSTLNNRLDSDVVLKLRDLNIEKLVASLRPDLPPAKTTTTLNADLELQSPAMVALSRFPSNSSDPIGTLSVHNFKLQTDNPKALNARLDFVTCDLLEAALTSLPVPGQPIQMHHVSLVRPMIRAMAMKPESPDFAGFTQLKLLASSLSPPSTQPAVAAASPSTAPTVKPSQLFRLQSLSVDDAGLYYNPWIYTTVPMNLTGISASVLPDSPVGDAYQFKALVPSDPDLHVDVSGRANVDTLFVDALKLAMDVKLKIGNCKAFPPQLQKQMLPFSPEGVVRVEASGTVPGKQPLNADLIINFKGDNLKATANGYRIPIDHLRVPIHLQNRQATFLDSAPMGGPTLNTCSGYATVAGVMELDQFLTSTLKLQTTGILLQDLMATKIVKPAPDLVGSVESKINLQNAPLLVIAAHATPPPGPNDPPTKPSLLNAIGLPPNWGTMQLHMDHARLAGLEIVQGINNAFKSVFTNLFNRDSQGETSYVEPKETADLNMVFEGEQIHLTLAHYIGEVVGADAKGYIGLSQRVDLHVTGGPQAKLAELGSVGDWFKKASDSILNIHVTGVPNNLKYEVTHGDGKPIGKMIDTTGDKVKGAAKQGVDTLKGGFQKLFGN